jgi:tetratricopeptide (TPR) repeat protein/tRNA A-37 threonylcarbamoyl transferase component Bud32
VIERTVSHYRLRERLGAGANGEVYLAEDLRLHRPVALKMLRTDAEHDANAAARLLREARVASALSHPNIAVVYEVGELAADEGPRGFIAMEHVRGRTLRERLGEGPLPAPDALAVARQVAEALREAHESGVVHRDVKPGNVMVTDRGLVKVLDFGLAKYVPPDADTSATWSGRHGALEGGGAILGTLAYMSPEQARGAAVDARSDVWALGALLYEMLAGRPPFTGGSAVALLEALLRDEPAPLLADSPVAEALGRLALRMLAKERSARPPDMRAVLDALDEAAAGRAPEDGHGVAILGFANLTGKPEDEWLGTGLAESLAVGLADIPGLTVVPRERSLEVLRRLQAAESEEPARAVRFGRELGVACVVTGGYQVLGEQVRVTARVIGTGSGATAITLMVDGLRSAIFDLQDRLARALGSRLLGHLPPPPPRPEGTRSLAAFEAYSKGLVNLRAETREDLDRAILFFERAVELDPGYARAHMHLGAAFDLKADYLTTPDLGLRALACLDRTLQLQPDCAEAWRHKGSALTTLDRDQEAMDAYERALAMNPTDAWSYSGMGRVHFILRGDFARAMVAFERALGLNPQAGWAALQLAHCAALARDLDKAETWARRAIVLQQELLSGRTGIPIVGGWIRLGQTRALQGRHAEAIAEYEHELEFLKGADHALRARIFIELHQRRGEARLRLGEPDAGRADLDLALEAFARRVRSGSDDPMTRYYAACAHALRGDTEDALACLERAAQRRRALTVARARLEPALESLRAEAAWAALMAGEVHPTA